MAGEKSGSLTEVLDRYINYQKLALAVRKKVMVSLMYPCVLIVLVILLMVFLVTYVVPDLRQPLHQHAGEAADHDGVPDRDRHGGAELHRVFRRRRWSAASSCSAGGRGAIRRGRRSTGSSCACRSLGEIWLKYQVAQFVAHSEHAADGRHPAGAGDGNGRRFAGHAAARSARWRAAGKSVREGQPLSGSLKASKMFPGAGDRHDRGRRIHRRAAGDAEQRGGVFRRRRQHAR